MGFGGTPAKVKVVLVDYDPRWPRRFAEQRSQITAALGDRALAVDHIGSTSVPGLAAKPIVDICLTVADSADEPSYIPDLVATGFELRFREPTFHEHRFLRTTDRSVHVHVLTKGSSEIMRYLVFRDRLRSNAADRSLYEATKRELAQHDWPTVQHYADAKSEVVEEIIKRALEP